MLFILLIFFALSPSFAKLVTKKLSPFGAEVLELTLGKITDNQHDELLDLLIQHKVVVLRNQSHMTIPEMHAFTSKFGPVYVPVETNFLFPGFKDVSAVSNVRNDTGHNVGLHGPHDEIFHADRSWADMPTKFTFLKSIIRPTECGTTIFLDTTAAYEALNTSMKLSLDGKRASYCYLKSHKMEVVVGVNPKQIAQARKCAVHPIITTHPITKLKNIYANPAHTSGMQGVNASTSNQILSFLYGHTKNSAFEYQHEWLDSDFVMWDNRQVHHRATDCSQAFPRYLVRTSVSCDVPPSR